jgi:ketosteroid isomerase-like protein
MSDRALTEEEAALLAGGNHSTWDAGWGAYSARSIDLIVGRYAPDALSIPANHGALRRLGDYEMNAVSQMDSVDVIGDIAITSGIFRVTRKPEDGVAGLDHGGRYLTVMRRVDGEWLLWRDMDTPSPDADVLYGRLPRGG